MCNTVLQNLFTRTCPLCNSAMEAIRNQQSMTQKKKDPQCQWAAFFVYNWLKGWVPCGLDIDKCSPAMQQQAPVCWSHAPCPPLHTTKRITGPTCVFWEHAEMLWGLPNTDVSSK